MELVYLWVEEYKNIKSQGFNFSPGFDCKYDEDTNELTIDEKKDYVSIFPENINITAIVGENGSGKSGISGELYSWIKQHEVKRLKKQKSISPYKKYNFIYLFKSEDDKFHAVNNLKLENIDVTQHSFFFEFEGSEDIHISVALGEFNNMSSHRHYDLASSSYSILPLRSYEILDIDEKMLKEEVLNKITTKYDSKKIIQSLLYELSFGEKYKYFLYTQILNRIKKNKYSIIFLDEVTLSMHPTWQKLFIHELISICKNYNVHFIISSHSPFILSDLTKENAIFLKDGEQKYPFKDKQTFGANIHTLLSDGFFMSDGLMGEFAKGKINDVIKYLNPNNQEETEINTDDEAKNIIDIVGEPVLKNTLLTMYDDKIYKEESKLQKLERKQKEIEEAIKTEKAKGKLDEEN